MFEWFLIENEGILVFSFLKTFDLLNFYSYRIVQCPQKLPSKIDNNNCHPKVTKIKWPPFPSLGIFIRIGALLDYRSVFSKMYSICVFLALWVLLRANIGFNGLVVSNVEFYTPPQTELEKAKTFRVKRVHRYLGDFATPRVSLKFSPKFYTIEYYCPDSVWVVRKVSSLV